MAAVRGTTGMKKIGIIGVPSSAGARKSGQEQAPRAYRRAGLTARLRSAGLSVTDHGDIPEIRFQPDQQHPNAQNLHNVVGVASRVAERVNAVVRDEAIALVLGGDCTITLGVVAGLIPHAPSLGLAYVDGDLDLNTPSTTPSGIFDGMVMAHLTGKGADPLAHLGPRYPLMGEEEIVLFGYNAAGGGIDPVEVELLQRCRMAKYPISEIRGNARASATEALDQLEQKVDATLIHFDVDVIDVKDFPAVDVPHPRGLRFDEAMSALEAFVRSPKLMALVITEFNAQEDIDGVLASRLVDSIAAALEARNS